MIGEQQAEKYNCIIKYLAKQAQKEYGAAKMVLEGPLDQCHCGV